MAFRIYPETVKKWLIASGITGGMFITGLFAYLTFIGAVQIDLISNTPNCAGNNLDMCTTCYSLYVNKIWGKTNDIFVYPLGSDPWGRNNMLSFDPDIKSASMRRWYGRYWYEYNLNEVCRDTRCGYSPVTAPDSSFALAWREGKNYTICVDGYKYDPRDVINWSINPTGIWDEALIEKKCNEITVEDCKTVKIPILGNVNYNESIPDTKCKEEEIYSEINDSYWTNITCVTTYKDKEKIKEEIIGYDTIEECKDKIIKVDCVIEYAGYSFNYEANGFNCSEDMTVCDDCTSDGNCNGICDSGETCVYPKGEDKLIVEVDNGKYKKTNTYKDLVKVK